MHHLTSLSVFYYAVNTSGKQIKFMLQALFTEPVQVPIDIILYVFDACMPLSPPQEGMIVVQLIPNCGEINMFKPIPIMSEFLHWVDTSFKPWASESQRHSLSPAAVVSVLTTRPWPVRQNRLALTERYITPATKASQFCVGMILHLVTCTWHWCIDIIRVEEIWQHVPYIGSRVNTKYDRISSWNGWQFRTLGPRIAEVPSTTYCWGGRANYSARTHPWKMG